MQDMHIPHGIINVNFSSTLVIGQDYLAFLAHVQQLVTVNSHNAAYHVLVLSPQTRGMKPYWWLMLDISGRGQDKTMVVVRQDNLYDMCSEKIKWSSNDATQAVAAAATAAGVNIDDVGLIVDCNRHVNEEKCYHILFMLLN
ncbi:uncharacterized protein LOC112271152 [Brachypodium distachyon]|uniref:uncharacterized protein LOC112271152 n=1 Tax=Brachypodium distachyon TaxID=15368 RepID=UPI000D0D7F97|nr:uncharacterized protein LOC112271152 [Brachypodium distachyon]|eukprot:XP_024315974.1 uncharacterized protein LOC112271152 [Brachypodium distachyon]